MEGNLRKLKRSPKKEVLCTNSELSNDKLLVELADASNTMFMVLNTNRQIVIANKKLIQIINSAEQNIIGQRPGEVFNCINSSKFDSECGTHAFCQECETSKAIANAIKGITTHSECRISSLVNGQHVSFDLEFQCQQMVYLGKNYILLSVIDISDKKRREVLEKTFFHDILNTAGGVYGFAKILKNKLQHTKNEYKIADITFKLAERLVKEIKGQQILLAAEQNNLNIEVSEINIRQLINDSIELIKESDNSCKCSLRQYFSHKEIRLKTDEILLQKVIINLLKNASEASNSNDSISIRVNQEGKNLTISVRNKAYIPKNIQHQLFQRSFSTKGDNRGIGTYSIKLFTENYLQGKVWFTSTKSRGTYFYVQLPLEPKI